MMKNSDNVNNNYNDNGNKKDDARLKMRKRIVIKCKKYNVGM